MLWMWCKHRRNSVHSQSVLPYAELAYWVCLKGSRFCWISWPCLCHCAFQWPLHCEDCHASSASGVWMTPGCWDTWCKPWPALLPGQQGGAGKARVEPHLTEPVWCLLLIWSRLRLHGFRSCEKRVVFWVHSGSYIVVLTEYSVALKIINPEIDRARLGKEWATFSHSIYSKN